MQLQLKPILIQRSENSSSHNVHRIRRSFSVGGPHRSYFAEAHRALTYAKATVKKQGGSQKHHINSGVFCYRKMEVRTIIDKF